MEESTENPVAELLSLALPTMAQMASYTLMQFIDTWMLSRLGGEAPTAAANSGIAAFSLVSFGYGVTLLVNTLVSQSFGSGDFRQCGRYLWQGIWLGILFGLATFPLRSAAGPMFAMFHHPPEQTAMEISYYRIVLSFAALKLISTAIGQFLLGINRAGAVLISAASGVTINAIVAWCIVLGHGGFHAMGVVGAAWAQNIGVGFELLIVAALALRPGIRKPFGVMSAALLPREMATLLRIGIPSGLQFFSDILAWAIFCNGILGILGPAAMAGNTFMLRYILVSFMPAYGMGAAVTALVGRYIGAKRPDIAAKRAHLAFVITLLYTMLIGILSFIFRRPLMEAFTDDAQTIRIGAIFLIYGAIYELFDAMYIIYNGALRGAGDTLVPTLVMAGLCWTISIGGGYIVARHSDIWGVGGVWLVGSLYGAILGIYMMARFIRGRWQEIKLGNAATSA